LEPSSSAAAAAAAAANGWQWAGCAIAICQLDGKDKLDSLMTIWLTLTKQALCKVL
jgi:hypothetical protein